MPSVTTPFVGAKVRTTRHKIRQGKKLVPGEGALIENLGNNRWKIKGTNFSGVATLHMTDFEMVG